jgi:hypothetical protein
LFTNPDGSLYNRVEFLDLIGKGPRISELREDQVNVRLFGDFAIIHVRIQYRSKAGIERLTRITARRLWHSDNCFWVWVMVWVRPNDHHQSLENQVGGTERVGFEPRVSSFLYS